MSGGNRSIPGWFAKPFYVLLGMAFLSNTNLATISLLAACGLGAIIGGLFGEEFHWKPRGYPGPRMPGWFARPYFVLLGIAVLADVLALCH
jgi:hypothetical protein